MPNGPEATTYNPAWCKEKHKVIDSKFDHIETDVQRKLSAIWTKFHQHEKLMWGTLLALIANLGGVAAILLKLVLSI